MGWSISTPWYSIYIIQDIFCIHSLPCSRFSRYHHTLDTEIQGYRNTGLHGYIDTGMQEYRATGIQGYRDTWIQRYRDTGIQGYRDTGIQGYRGIQHYNTSLKGFWYTVNKHGFWYAEMQEYQDTKISIHCFYSCNLLYPLFLFL